MPARKLTGFIFNFLSGRVGNYLFGNKVSRNQTKTRRQAPVQVNI